MKRRRLMLFLLFLGVFGTASWAVFQRYWYYVPGLLADFRDPVEPFRPVTWARGPETAPGPPGARPPNIVVIVADDLGWNDLTLNGGGVADGSVPTPRINSIGADGVIFSQGYAGNATCAPARAAIMTGRYATRFGFEFTPAPKAFSKLISTYEMAPGLPAKYFADRERDVPDRIDDLTVPTSETMIGQALKTRGYHSVMLGKWHLGGTPTTRPEARGFDEALAFYEGAAMFLPESHPDVVNSRQDFDPIDKFLWANLRHSIRFNGSTRFRPDLYMTDYLGREAVRAIEANRNRPFFMYLAFNAVHTPLQALRADYEALAHIADHRLRVYGALVRSLDRNVGLVLDALKAQGLDDNTLVIFTSDNGGANYIGLPDINRPLRGWKATFFEGGIRVPFLMKWPARLAKGLRYDRPIGHVDIFATVAAAAGAGQPTDRTMDGVDLTPLASGARGDEPHKALFWRSGDYRVILSGDWKLQTSERPRKVWLHNIRDDPSEQRDLSMTQPQIRESLMRQLEALDREQVRPLWPSLLESPVMIDTPLGLPARPDGTHIYWAN